MSVNGSRRRRVGSGPNLGGSPTFDLKPSTSDFRSAHTVSSALTRSPGGSAGGPSSSAVRADHDSG